MRTPAGTFWPKSGMVKFRVDAPPAVIAALSVTLEAFAP